MSASDPTGAGRLGRPPLVVVDRCGCGRVALARCWLGDTFPARSLVSCARRSPLAPETPEAA